MSVASVALLFAAMGGARTMDSHLLAGHGAHFGHIIADEEAVVSHDAHASHGGHHPVPSAQSDDAQQQEQQPSSADCTCVGPCQGGSAPGVTQTTTYVAATHEVESAPLSPRKIRLVHHDATSHLLPLPNAPPALL